MLRDISIRTFFAVVGVLTLFACGGGGGTRDSEATPVDTLYAPRYAGGFVVTARIDDTTNRRIMVMNPWQNASGVVKCLTIEKGREPQRIVVMSSTHVAMLDAIGATDRIVGVSGKDFVTCPALRARYDDVVDVGFDGNVDYERLAALRPDLVMLYGVGGESRMEAKLRDLGIATIYVGDFVEESPLGKAEWMVALGEIVGRPELARKRFDEIASRYEQLRDSVAKLGLEPTVAMMNAPYGDSWLLPAQRSYAVRLIGDAGGRLAKRIADEGSAPTPIGLEEALALTAKSDVWLAPGNARSYGELLTALPKFATTRPVATRRVFSDKRRVNPSGGNDFWESGIVKPDTMLRDLVKILHPELLPDYETYFYEPLK